MLNNVLPFGPLLVLCLAILVGGFTNGLAGFAFAAVSGGLVFSVLPPTSAVCVLAAGGMTLQCLNNLHFFKQVNWRKIMIFAIPGFFGIPLGSYLLTILPRTTVALVFGIVLLSYVTFTIFKKPGVENDFGGRVGDVLLGFIGGFVAGLLAVPGIPVVIMCSIRNYGKVAQRSISVPFNLLMLLGTIALSGLKGNYGDPVTQVHLLIALPICVAGWAIGVRLFGRISELGFRRFVSGVLIFSGIVLVFPSLKSFIAPTHEAIVQTIKNSAN